MTTMNKNQNDHSEVSKEHLYTSNNFRIPVHPDTPLKSAFNPYGPPLINQGTYSFIVEWQLPAIEIQNAK